MIKKTIQSTVSKLGYKLTRISSQDESQFSVYEVALASLAAHKKELRIVIVGANDGKYNDPGYSFINTYLHTRSKVLLIEPQEKLHKHIRKHYEGHGSFELFNGCVGKSGRQQLFTIKEDYWEKLQPAYANNWPVYRAPTGIASFSRDEVADWIKMNFKRINNPIDYVEAIDVETKDLASILDFIGWEKQIDVLQIDAEGFDDEVIYASNLDSTQPRLILFESKNIPEKRIATLEEKLSSKGYILVRLRGDTLAIKITH